MKNNIYILIILILSSCQLIPDLDRDNPLDENYSGDKSQQQLDISIDEIDYAFAYVSGNNNAFSPGSKVYVELYIKNKSNFSLESLVATVDTDNSLIQLVTEYFPVSFSKISGSISSNDVVLGKLYDNNNNLIEAPNGLPYSFYIEISDEAVSGENILFSILFEDNYQRECSRTFNIKIN